MQTFDMKPLAAAAKAARPRHYAVGLGAAVLALLAAVAAVKIPSASADAMGAPRTAAAVVGDIESTVLASGTLQAEDQVNVGAQASGQVNSLKVALGQQVKKGDLIAEIDATAQKSELRNAEAALKSLEAQMRAKQVTLQQAELALKRQRYLLQRDAISRADYENAETAWSLARAEIVSFDAQIEQSRTQVSKVRADLEHTRIRAPIGGTVVAIVTKEGQTLNSAQQVPTIVKLARLDKLQVKIQISEADVARVKAGQQVHFTLLGDAGHPYHARLRVVEPVPESAGQGQEGMAGGGGGGMAAVYYNGLFSVPNPDGKLRIGMSAQVSIVVDSARNAVLIPLTALGEKRSDGRHVVQVLRNGQPEERAVQAGVRDSRHVQIVQGLQAGEQVVLQEAAAPAAAGEAAGEAE